VTERSDGRRESDEKRNDGRSDGRSESEERRSKSGERRSEGGEMKSASKRECMSGKCRWRC
jgi:hypothetical protein